MATPEGAQWWLACAGTACSLAGIIAIVTGAPWQLRFPLLALGILYGPGVPVMVRRSGLSTGQGLVAGVGLSLALLLVAAQAMLMLHAWSPSLLVAGLLALAVLLSLSALRRGSR